ncbi:hypothetical protein ACWFMI_05520 [Nocardiopsis terrae]
MTTTPPVPVSAGVRQVLSAPRGRRFSHTPAPDRARTRPQPPSRQEQLLAQMRGNPRVEHRLAHGELPAWMHVAAQRRRTPAPVPRPRPAPDDGPTRPGPGLPPLPRRPRSHRKPRRKFGWFVTIYALATAAGALIQHVFSNLL